jgi:hypothetical protein
MPDLALPLAMAVYLVCLVLDTAAVEVIPTNDLPPSTTLRAVVRCGTR